MNELRPMSLRDRNRLRTRNELLDAVLNLFAEGGLSACSVDAAAKFVGASKTTAYSYFPGGVDEMFRDLYRQITQRVVAEASDLRSRQDRPEARIFALASALLTICAEPKIGKFYMMLTPSLSPMLEPVVGEGSGQFREMIESDLIAVGKPDHLAAGFAILITGALRESAIVVAKDPGQTQALLTAIGKMIKSLIGHGA